MPLVKCPYCQFEKFYNNISGTTLDGLCGKCNGVIKIPYQSAHRMTDEEAVCRECGKTMMVGAVGAKGYMSFHDGSHGITKKFKRTPWKHTKNICEECYRKENTRECVKTITGEGVKRMAEVEENKILESYKKTTKVKDTAKETGYAPRIVRSVLRKNGIFQRKKK